MEKATFKGGAYPHTQLGITDERWLVIHAAMEVQKVISSVVGIQDLLQMITNCTNMIAANINEVILITSVMTAENSSEWDKDAQHDPRIRRIMEANPNLIDIKLSLSELKQGPSKHN